MKPGQKYPKSRRLLSQRDFRAVLSKGRRFVGQFLIIDYNINHHSNVRLGIAASKRYGKAHQRNRFKRMTREAFRTLVPQMPQGWEMIVRPRKHAQTASSCQIAKEMLSFLNDSSFLKTQP